MPYKSQAQAGYFHTHKAELEAQGVDVGEWDKATKGKHLPQKLSGGGVVFSKGSGLQDANYAKGGGELPRREDWSKTEPQGRGDYGRFLGTKDRFTGKHNDTEDKATDETWVKPDGVGHTDRDDKGDCKSETPVKARGTRHSSVDGG